MKLKITKNSILDILFILAYSVGYVSLLKFVTYALIPVPESIALFLFLFIIYIIRFKGWRTYGMMLGGNLFTFLLILYIWEIVQGFIVGTDINAILVVIVNLLSTYVAYRYMNNIITIKGSVMPIIDCYSIYMYYTFFIIITSAVLLITTILSSYSCPLGMNSLFRTNMEMDNVSYYFPGYLSVVYHTPSVLLGGLGFPSLSGLSHESQAMYYTIYPALFLMFCRGDNNTENKIIVLFLISTIITTSLTAAVCFMLTYALHLLWKFKDKGQYKSVLLMLFSFSLLAYFVIDSQFNEIINSFVLEKANFDSDGSSGSYSLSLLLYMLTPSGALGQGILGSTSDQTMQFTANCGYISSMLILVFYVFFIYTSLKNVFSYNLLCHSIGLASFYFIAHSFKYGISLFNSNYLFFMVFLMLYAEKRRKIVI